MSEERRPSKRSALLFLAHSLAWFMKKSSQFWRRPVVYRSAIGLYILLVLIVAAVSFGVSIFDVRGALYMRGASTFEVDRLTGLRGSFQYAPTGEVLAPEELELRLVHGESREGYELEFPQDEPLKSWPDVQLRVPEGAPAGEYELEVKMGHKRAPRFLARAPIRVEEEGRRPSKLSDVPWPKLRPRDDEADRRRVRVVPKGAEQPVALAVTPGDGELARGFSGRVIFRVYEPETGQPVAGRIFIGLERGLVESEIQGSIPIDPLGFAVLEVWPGTDLDLDVKVEDLEGQEYHFEVRLSAVPAQYQVRPSRQIVLRSEGIEASINSVLNDPSYMVDLYDLDGDYLLETLTLSMRGQRGGARFLAPAPGESSPLLRVQAYQSVYGVEHGWDSRYILLLDDDSRQRLLKSARELFGWIVKNTDDVHYGALLEGDYLDEELIEGQLRRLIAVGLEEIPRSFELPPVLMNTREADREAMAAWQDGMRRDMALLLGFLLFGGLVLVFYFVALGVARQQREAQLLAELDLEHEESAYGEELARSIRLERMIAALQGLLVLATLVALAIGIHMVVSYL